MYCAFKVILLFSKPWFRIITLTTNTFTQMVYVAWLILVARVCLTLMKKVTPQEQVILESAFDSCNFKFLLLINYIQTQLKRTARDRPFLFVITGVRYNRVTLYSINDRFALKI